MHKKLQ